MKKKITGVRNHRIRLLITDAEHSMIEDMTRELGLSRSDLYRHRLFSPEMMNLNHSKLLITLGEIGQEIGRINVMMKSLNVDGCINDTNKLMIDYIQMYIEQQGKLEQIFTRLLAKIANRQ